MTSHCIRELSHLVPNVLGYSREEWNEMISKMSDIDSDVSQEKEEFRKEVDEAFALEVGDERETLANEELGELRERNGGLNTGSMPDFKPMEKSEERKELESWLNKIMRIKISDGRTLIGSFLCTDKDRNIILGSCQEYVGKPGVNNEDPRILGLAMIPGRHIQSIEIDMDRPNKFGEFV